MCPFTEQNTETTGCVGVMVALTDNFSRELGSDFYIREGVVDRIWIKVGGSEA